jgi:nucleotide-binding universal stress UspA family protein
MKILICSDGMPAADNATLLGGLLAKACAAEMTLLGIVERADDEKPLREALEAQGQALRADGIQPQIAVKAGEPVAEILKQASTMPYDLVVIGSRRTGSSGLYWRTEKTYEVIKVIPAPVLVAMGAVKEVKRFLVCTGGKAYIDAAVALTAKVAAAVGGTITLLHVMAEPPALYADLVSLEEDLERLLESGSELGRNLVRQKKELEALGVPVEVRVRHGIVVDQILAEAHEGRHDIIVTGSSEARGALRHYIMGDVTRTIVNVADVPVLVARSVGGTSTFWSRLKHAFVGTS